MDMLHDHFAQDGFAGVHVKTTESGHALAIGWVDDIIIAGSNTDLLNEAKIPGWGDSK